MTAAGQIKTIADISATAMMTTYSWNAINAARLLRHRRSPEVLIEERFPVLLRNDAEETGHILRGSEFETERLRVRLHERKKRYVADFFVDRVKKERTLVIEQRRPRA